VIVVSFHARLQAVQYLASSEDVDSVIEEAASARLLLKSRGAGCAIPYAIFDEGDHVTQGAQSAEAYEEILLSILAARGRGGGRAGALW
jgi:predicted DsbA family dithiol-disulfide isomerase